ncbi:hypothetical protein, partial [Nonomuraea candida]|uniref:hypothetical protein n=1 Tax=Nonomuraea candida TaxID=359159 RepID=UPI0005BB59DE
MPDPQPDPGRRCASPFCRKELPADATSRRRYCSGACRQAAWRIEHPAAVTRPSLTAPEELEAMEEAARRRAAHLAALAQHVVRLEQIPLSSRARHHDRVDRLLVLVNGLPGSGKS